MTMIPLAEHGAASFEMETFRGTELLAGNPPTVWSNEAVGESTELPQFAVVGVQDGKLVMATFGGEGAAASGALTFSGNAVADETVTIGGVTYAWKAAPAAANEVLVGASAAASAANLILAINAGERTEGAEEYGDDTEAHPDVIASQGATASVVELQADEPGQAGEVATTETMTNAAFGSATLTGGIGSGVKAIGVTTASVSTGSGESATVDVFRDGVWNLHAVKWDASFNTQEKMMRAADGGPSPYLQFKPNPHNKQFPVPEGDTGQVW